MGATVGEAGAAAGSASEPPRPRPPRALIFAITLTGILNNSLIGPALPDIIDEFGVSSSAAGFLVAAGSLPGIVVAPVIGLLADRYGRRAVLVPCLVIFGVCGPLGAAAPTFSLLLLARLLQGFGTAGLINLAVVLIGDHWSGRERTTLIGRNAAALTLGLALSPLAGGVIADVAGWRTSFLCYGVALLTAVAAWRRLPPDRPDARVDPRAQLRDAALAARNPVVLTVIVGGGVVFVLIFGLVLTVFPVHLADEFGLSASRRGLLLAAPAVGASLVAFNLGRITSRLTINRLLLLAGLSWVVGFGAVGAAGVLAVAAGGVMLYGLGEGLLIPTLQDVINHEAPDSQRGAVMAAWVGAARLGQTTGPLLAAAALTVLSTGQVFLAGAVLAGLLTVGLLLSPVTRTTAIDD